MPTTDTLTPAIASSAPPTRGPTPVSAQQLSQLDYALHHAPQATAAWVDLWLAVARLGPSYLHASGIIEAGQTQMQLPTHDPWAWLAAARMAESYGEWSSALSAYEHAQNLRPHDLMTQLWRAHCLARLGRLEEADTLMQVVGRSYAWPARITRMGEHFWRELDRQPPGTSGELYWDWLVPPPHWHASQRRLSQPLDTVILIAMDGVYWERYAERVLGSWQQMLTAATAAGASTAMHLHIHLMNATASQRDSATARMQHGPQLSLCHEELILPIAQEEQARYMREHRTWYACSRLRILPWWLAQCHTGVIITDADITWQRSPLQVWQAVGAATVGCVRSDPRARILWEDWYLSLAAFRASNYGQHIAAHLAAYVDFFLRCGDGVWALDRAALWSVFARHGAAMALEPPRSQHIAALPAGLIHWPGAPHHNSAILATATASHEEAAASERSALRTVAHTQDRPTSAPTPAHWAGIAAAPNPLPTPCTSL